jgi:gas vesicle protein
MADSYDRYDTEGAGGGFMMGLLTGTVLGAGLGMLLAPKAGSELRGAIGEQARHLGSTASGWAGKGREFVDKARDAVSRGGEEARGYAGGTTGSSYGSGTAGSSFGGSTGSTGSSYGSTGTTGGSFGSSGSTSGSDYNR